MTIATTRTNELTISQIVTMAYRRAGLLEAHQTLDTALAAIGQQELQLVCDALEARGLMARSTEMYVLSLTSGTANYELPDYTLAVVNAAMYVPAGESSPAQDETFIRHISQEDWQTIADKTLQSTPSLYWHDRTVVPNQVYFWPIPNEDGSVRIQLQRLRADTTQGTNTVDFERYWHEALVFRLASNLCFNASMPDKGLQYRSLAEAEIQRCLSNARDQGGFQLSVSAGRWSR